MYVTDFDILVVLFQWFGKLCRKLSNYAPLEDTLYCTYVTCVEIHAYKTVEKERHSHINLVYYSLEWKKAKGRVFLERESITLIG